LGPAAGGNVIFSEAKTPIQDTYPSPKSVEKAGSDCPDVLHFVDPANDSIRTLSIRYGVPETCLRRINAIYADHLLAARRTILIPGEYYKGGVSLSPQPPEGEEMESKKNKIRRLMVQCKVPE
jgi:hypothetical protein